MRKKRYKYPVGYTESHRVTRFVQTRMWLATRDKVARLASEFGTSNTAVMDALVDFVMEYWARARGCVFDNEEDRKAYFKFLLSKRVIARGRKRKQKEIN